VLNVTLFVELVMEKLYLIAFLVKEIIFFFKIR
jgi:hypothetical protein